MKVCLAILAGAAAAITPVTASAQLDLQSSPTPRYHLVQVSIDAAKIAPEEFKTRTGAITSCNDAKLLAEDIGADFRRNRFVLSTRLTGDIRDQLKGLRAGHATQVFTNDGSTMRVLVLCNVA